MDEANRMTMVIPVNIIFSFISTIVRVNFKRLGNSKYNVFDVVQHIVIPKAKNFIAL